MIVAAFDFDGTITDRDTLLAFLMYYAGAVKGTVYLMLSIPYLLAFVFKIYSREQTKEKVLSLFLKGEEREVLEEKARFFAKEYIPSMVKASALKRIAWHKSKGHKLVLVSASLEYYLEEWAALHGFDYVLATKLQFQDRRVTGKFDGKNCRRMEKVYRLQEIFGKDKSYTLFAYGDSQGDQELLAYADFPFYRQMPLGE